MTGLSKIALVVGGEGGLQLQLARWLSAFDIDSVHVDGADDALTLAARIRPDLIILTDDDDTSEILNFVEGTAALRRSGATRVMLCARAGDAALLSAAVAGGADECLVAPFDADLLRFKLEQTGVIGA